MSEKPARKQLSVRISAEEYEALDRYCAEQRIRKDSTFLYQAIREKLEAAGMLDSDASAQT